MPADRRILVLDDDPTGSQSVHDIDVVFRGSAVPGALAESGSCFVLTNARALAEAEAVALNREIVDPVLGPGLHLVSRSDSTLRGHVIAEPHALAEAWAGHGSAVDGFLFVPAMIEAGRFTREDVHYATVDGRALPVAETDFARDASFGYRSSNLREFLAEKSASTAHPVAAEDVLSIPLATIRGGGAEGVAEVLRRARDRAWVVVNATAHADLDVVARGLAIVEAQGRVFVSRCAPSFVRALAGMPVAEPLDAEHIAEATGSGRGERGLLVIGSHVALTSRQLAHVQRRSGLAEVELDVSRILAEGPASVVADAAGAVRRAWGNADVVVYTSRNLVRTGDPAESLRIAARVSDAVVDLVRELRADAPAWIVAKGGITSHEVAHRGLGIERARVVGQFFPGQVSLFAPVDAPPKVLGCPYVVFPGNVGSETALAEVIEVLRSAASRGDLGAAPRPSGGPRPG